ncbi:zinc finger protein SHOOT GRAVITROPISM 5 isoform X1 [Ipomoea triloba]|uniref:zinc finger protein SHOOT GRAVITROPISM 5 isoform X1 n=2 Tax=Ipomoea triloba TaxID=35885 RepID=UPI00125D9FB6|nr:zinc finger protein SHOOT GRAVITROPISM 5 isoform X1 [Ipomoea triloba]
MLLDHDIDCCPIYISTMEDQHQRELHFLPTTTQPPSAAAAASTSNTQSWPSDSAVQKSRPSTDAFEGPSLDLQLSISVRPLKPPPDRAYKDAAKFDAGYVEALRWQAAEQIRLAAMEKAYAERVRELTRREIEMAQSEFARARSMWERAREEVKKAEQLKERATRRIDSTCMEITCHSCCQKFRPTS